MSTQPELIPGRPVPQSDHQIVSVSIRELCEQRDRFNISPVYQREDVWTQRESQQLIDTILQGQGIGLLEGYKYHIGGKTYWEIMDGHQRISAIQRFWDNEYKTWTEAVKRRVQPVSKYGPVEPGKYRDQISGYIQDYLLDYHVPITKTPEMTQSERASRFLAIQCHKSLTPAERLHVYPSEANAAATLLSEHPLWSDLYMGETGRKQLFLSSLYLIALQMAPSGIADLRSSSYVSGLASGKSDRAITSNLVREVQDRLDAVLCAYSGMQFTDRAAVIAMYQSIMRLEQTGCTIQSSTHKGRLAGWMTSVLDASKHASGLPVYHRPIQSLLFANGQKAFWNKHHNTVMTLLGVKTQESNVA